MGPVREKGRRGGFRLVVNRLYYDADKPASSGFAFDEEVLMKALRNIYARKGKEPTYIEENLFREFCRGLDLAVEKGFDGGDSDNDFRRALKHSNEVFSAFKVHRAQRDMTARLLDSKGNLKPFEQWLKDVQPIAGHQCRSWFKTEYDTAVLRAHQAADWQQFERERDVLPNLKWMPSTSVHPGADHRAFWGTVRPIDDPFWKKHRPGDRWNCKCSLSNTDEPATPLPEDVPASSKPQPGLTGNPGQEAAVFSQDHPYFPKDCKNCAFYKPNLKDSLKGAFMNRVKDCYDCPYIKACLERIGADGFKLERKYDNGGALYIHEEVEKDKGDYRAILTICRQLSKQGHIMRILPHVHYKSDEYRQIFHKLIGTKYDKKCPDFEMDGELYEYEGFIRPWNKKKVGRMLSHGLVQSSRLVIDNTKGCSDRFLRKQIMARVNLPGQTVDEVWIYEKGKVRVFYKDGFFHKNNGGN